MGFVAHESPDVAGPALVTALEFAGNHQQTLSKGGGADLLQEIVRFLASLPQLSEPLLAAVRAEMFGAVACSFEPAPCGALRALRLVVQMPRRALVGFVRNSVALCLVEMPANAQTSRAQRSSRSQRRQRWPL